MAKHFLAIMQVFLLSACASTPPVQFYVLEPTKLPTPSPNALVKQKSVGIGPLSIPALLNTKKIVTKTSDNTVKIAEFQQWASPLDESILQSLTMNLTALQPTKIVRAYPWSAHGTVDQQIIIDIIRFDASPGKSVNLEANWTIKNEAGNEVLTTGRTLLKRPITDSSYTGIVDALSKILGQFSQELSFALLQVTPTRLENK